MAQVAGNFGIVVSGGPAPGINSVISAAVIEANLNGGRVFGLHDGFEGISVRGAQAFQEITTENISRVHTSGGSILGTSRFNPFIKEAHRQSFLESLREQEIDKLIVIGGEGSAFLSYRISRECPGISVVHVPKTIDNDIPLPHNYPSFGFETARHAGARVLETLMVDSKTCRRWYIVTSMGRKAGYLALGLGLSAGATLTLIPEEFKEHISVEALVEVMYNSVQKRAAAGKHFGVIIIAEGVLDCIDPKTSPLLSSCARDELGRIHYAEIELGDVVLPALRERCRAAGLTTAFYTKNIGYELRCHPPVFFDLEYTKLLGYGAVQLLLNGKNGVMVTRDLENLSYVPLSALLDTDGVSIRSRQVDLSTDVYRVAREYMIR